MTSTIIGMFELVKYRHRHLSPFHFYRLIPPDRGGPGVEVNFYHPEHVLRVIAGGGVTVDDVSQFLGKVQDMQARILDNQAV